MGPRGGVDSGSGLRLRYIMTNIGGQGYIMANIDMSRISKLGGLDRIF